MKATEKPKINNVYLTSAIAAYIRFVIESSEERKLEIWLEKKYKWPKKVESDSPFKRIKLYFLFDFFFCKTHDEKILPRDQYHFFSDFLRVKFPNLSDLQYQSASNLKVVDSLLDRTLFKKNESKLKLIEDKYTLGNYQQTLKMKNHISLYLKENYSDKTKQKLAAIFYIKHWGGVDNGEKTIDKYLSKYTPDSTINDEYPTLEGVASWSKYLSVLHDWAHIYDARVCFALNVIAYLYPLAEAGVWKMKDGKKPTSGIRSASRNSRIGICEEFVLASNLEHYKHVHPSSSCYETYLRVLNEVSEKYNQQSDEQIDPSKVEMFLFIVADDELCKSIAEHESTHPDVAICLKASFCKPKFIGSEKLKEVMTLFK